MGSCVHFVTYAAPVIAPGAVVGGIEVNVVGEVGKFFELSEFGVADWTSMKVLFYLSALRVGELAVQQSH